MHRFGNLKTLFFSITRYLAQEYERFPEERKRAINDNITAEWLGEQQKLDSEIFGEITPFDVFARRAGFLHQSLQELREVTQWANVVPIKKLQISFAEQLEFVWWFHLNRIQQFQDRAFKFYVAAKELASDEAARAELGLNKKAFYKKFLVPLSGRIEVRDFWVHDFKPSIGQLQRLSSLDLFSKMYSTESKSVHLSNHLRKEALKLEKLEKSKLLKVLQNDQTVIEQLADILVVFVERRIDLHFLKLELISDGAP